MYNGGFEAAPRREVITVSVLNEYVKSLLDGDEILQNISIRGEISNFVHHRSGHLYFSLKDESGVIRAAMFRSSAASLRFSPTDGMKVIARGSVSLYPQSGSYQLYVSAMERDGVGALWLAYEALREKLLGEGLFDPARKKPLPRYPRTVGIVTSPTGAAVRDMIRILGRRYPIAEILLYPASVQGEGAAESVARGIAYFNEAGNADVLIIGRGGGSIEDLWAFNDGRLARTIAASHIPVISAVGHETDFTIADFVSDLRAATPSAAAELAVPDSAELFSALAALPERMRSRISERMLACRRSLAALTERPVLMRPDAALREPTMRLSMLTERMDGAVSAALRERGAGLAARAAKLEALSPLSTLARGYAVAETARGSIIRSVDDVRAGESFLLRVSDGELCATVDTVKKNEQKQGAERHE